MGFPSAVAAITLLLISVTGCASLAGIDRSNVNRPAMDLRTRLTPLEAPSFTPLDSVRKSSSGGACTACAH